jgi:hypothetical protein
METKQFAHLPDRLEVRELRYQIHRKGFRVQSITLVTTLLDAASYTVEALAQLYWARWGIEIYQSCNLRRTLFWPKFDSLRRHTAQRAVCDGEARRHMPWGWPPMIEPTPCLTEIPA